MHIKTTLLLTLWSILLLFIQPHRTLADYCSSAHQSQQLSKLFVIGDTVYFGGGHHNRLFTFDLASQTHGTASSSSEAAVTAASFAVHFDPVATCQPKQSNQHFCQLAKVWADMVILVGGGRSTVHHWNSGTKTLEPYSDRYLKNFDHTQGIPSLEARLYALILQVFKMAAKKNNPHLHFTGATYDASTDALYMSAIVVNDSIVKDPAWSVGKYVLFRANMSPDGQLSDATVVAQFKDALAGLMDYNGALFGLTIKGTILEVIADKVSQKTYSASEFLCSKGSPLKAKGHTPDRSSRATDAGGVPPPAAIFPHLGPTRLYIESSLLQGGTYVLIVIGLSLLLVGIVAVDAVIIYKMVKDDGGEVAEGDDSAPASSRRASSDAKKRRPMRGGV